MKKLFGVTKDKPRATTKPEDVHHSQDPPENLSEDDKQWELIHGLPPNSRHASLASLPPGASPPLPSPRAPSPFGVFSATPPAHKPAQLKKKAQNGPPGPTHTLGLLRSLDPSEHGLQRRRSRSEERERDRLPVENLAPGDHRRERKAFWSWEKDKKPSEDDGEELTKMIGFLTSTSADNWAITLEVCERASASDSNAKEAVRALRREFKYGQPQGQLAAARLWAVMLRNSSDTFVAQCTTRKFLETLEDLAGKASTEPVVKERLISVIAAAAFASGAKKDTGFKGLWRRIKPLGAPDDGIPFDADDVIFSPPIAPALTHSRQPSSEPISGKDEPALDRASTPDPHSKSLKPSNHRARADRKVKGIISLDEDMRRLFQECTIGSGNASLLSQALISVRPEEVETTSIIKEFYAKCRASQELICAQIDWATAGAERSRRERELPAIPPDGNHLESEKPQLGITKEEKLLASLLAANAELMEALGQYSDLERVAAERRAEDQSLRESREHQLAQHEPYLAPPDNINSLLDAAGSPSPPFMPHVTASHPRSRPSSIISSALLQDEHASSSPSYAHTHAPAGPRLRAGPASSRTPSPRIRTTSSPMTPDPDSSGKLTPIEPSAKALGKRRVSNDTAEDEAALIQATALSISHQISEGLYTGGSDSEDSEASQKESYQNQEHHAHHKPRYVYDAVAERSKEQLKSRQS